jgi:hypothetical protein
VACELGRWPTCPADRIQIDVKFVEPLKSAAKPAVGRRTKNYQFTAIDDCTRLRVLRIYPRCNQQTAIQLVDYMLQQMPCQVQTIQTDIQSECAALRVSCRPAGKGRRRPPPAHHRCLTGWSAQRLLAR